MDTSQCSILTRTKVKQGFSIFNLRTTGFQKTHSQPSNLGSLATATFKLIQAENQGCDPVQRDHQITERGAIDNKKVEKVIRGKSGVETSGNGGRGTFTMHPTTYPIKIAENLELKRIKTKEQQDTRKNELVTSKRVGTIKGTPGSENENSKHIMKAEIKKEKLDEDKIMVFL